MGTIYHVKLRIFGGGITAAGEDLNIPHELIAVGNRSHK
jgi:hypothetical protein